MAETRETQVLEDVVESTEIENPRTTEEAILAQVIAGDEVTINARTRLQTYLSQLTSGGGNPNYVETITGTLANPWGDIDLSDLVTKIPELANIEMVADTPNFGLFKVIAFYSDTSVSYLIGQQGSIEGSAILVGEARWDIETGNLTSCKLFSGTETGGVFFDLLPIANYSPSTTKIYYHPLPEDNT